MGIEIQQIAFHLPDRVVSNRDLHEENPAWDMDLIEARTGVRQRHITADDETALDLAVQACEKLFLASPALRTAIDGVIFCTQSADHILPPNSSILHGKLDLPDDVFALDFNLACSGFVYGLALAKGLVASGTAKNILLVTADTYSKYINKKDRSTRVLFGDAAAATWIAGSASHRGIIDIQCSTSGKGYQKFMIPAGGTRLPKSEATSGFEVDSSGNHRTLDDIHMDGMGMLMFVKSKVPDQVRKVLARNSMTVDDIDLFVFHQASKIALDSLTRSLKIEPTKVWSDLENIGNTVSASIPIALKHAIDSGRIGAGDQVLISGFGVGLSWGTAILKY